MVTAVAAIAVACAGAGVVVASWLTPPAAPEPVPAVTLTVTQTHTAHPVAPGPVVASPPAINLEERSIDDPASAWVVINKRRPLQPQQFVPTSLTTTGLPGNAGAQLTPDAARALKKLYDAAENADAPFLVSTAYRSYGFQQGVYGNYVATRGRADADTFSARPGYSEHQTGLAVDLYDPAGCHLKRCYEDTASGAWVAANAADYGFIFRYPEGESAITGYKYEPWHLRYVGVDLAQYMRDNNIATMEEVFGLPPAPDYDD